MTTKEAFLSEGAKSYIDALAAIEAFQRAACAACKVVCDKYRPELASKMGLADADCEDHDKNIDPANRYAELGVWQKSPSGREWLYVYLMWDDAKNGEPEISACVSLEFSRKIDREGYAKSLRAIPSIQSGEDDGYYLLSSRKLGDLSSCAETLDQLLSEWLECWPAGRKLK
ncbi:MAG: hypothetical protein ACLQKA_03645 [Bryobacteraceae bacterium]